MATSTLEETSDMLRQQRARDKAAAFLSIIPGLGHIYKGYYIGGLAIMLIGIPSILWISVLGILGTAGLSLLITPISWLCVGVHAFASEDKRHHL